MKRAMPLPATINDCLLLNQMGFDVEVSGGIVTRVIERKERQRTIIVSRVFKGLKNRYLCLKSDLIQRFLEA